MEDKQPIPSPDGVPTCFGVQFDERDLNCTKRCELHAHCAPRSSAWASRRSLTELYAHRLAQLDAPQEAESLEAIYDRLHRDIFGKRSRRTDTERNEEIFARLFGYFQREDIDPATYVAGNMWAMKPWVEKNQRIGFQPTHLSGEKALRRYFAYRGKQSRRFRQQRHTGDTSGTIHGDIRQALYLGEYDVAEEYVKSYVAGTDDWDAAIAEARPNDDWLAAETLGKARHRRRYHELCVALGTQRLREEKALVRLKAACDIAEHFEHDLAHRIGVFGAFTWEAFASLLTRLFPIDGASDSLSLAEVTGAVWHG